MDSITIKVNDEDIILSNKEEYKDFLTDEGVKFLRDRSNKRVGGFASLVGGERYTLGPPTQQQQQHGDAQTESLPNFGECVFLLYRGDSDAIGTAFAISSELMLTACHNVLYRSDGKKQVSQTTDLKVALAIDKAAETMKITAVGVVREVEVHRYNIDVDWACLRVKNGVEPFPSFIPLAKHQDDLPKAATLEKMYIYHCPVQLFLDDVEMDRCHVMVKEASVGIVGRKTITFQNGGFPGSSGGPYVFRNKAIALHVDSVSTTKTANDLKDETTESKSGRLRKLTPAEVTRMMVDSCVSSHTSLGSGIILHVRSGIRNLLTEDQEGTTKN